MNTAKTKRWDGKIESLSAEYLNGVLEQMLSYGDRVQFALTRGGQRPHYQVINTSDKKMTFDGNHLLTSDTEHFVSGMTSPIHALEKVEAVMNGVGVKTTTTRSPRSSGGSNGVPRTTAAQREALIDAEKYEYFKNNRASLPANISKYSKEISALMLNGMSVEDAFDDAVKRCG